MYYGAYLGLVPFRSVDRVIDGEKMPLRQLVYPLDQDGLLTPYFERGPRARAGISPERRRRHVAVDSRLKLPHGNAIVGHVRAWMDRTAAQAGYLRDRRNWQRINVTRERVRVEQCNTRLLDRAHIMLRIRSAHCGRGGKQARVPQELPSSDLHPYSKADSSRRFSDQRRFLLNVLQSRRSAIHGVSATQL
jgi:hypothetical protein